MWLNSFYRTTIIIWFVTKLPIYAQTDTISKLNYTVDGFVESYYLYDISSPKAEFRPNFYYNHYRSNEPALNMAMLRLTATAKRFKTTYGMMTGSYVTANLADEPELFKNIYEANVSYQLKKGKQLWLQAGIFSSHIGFESAIGADCYTLSRSLAADNSPYYETGLKLNYKSKNEDWEYNLLILNGWQQMPHIIKKWRPALGMQITYSKNKYSFNYSNYIGNEGEQQNLSWRFFNNFYLIAKPFKRISYIVGLDVGCQYYVTKATLPIWYTPQAVIRYQLSKKVNLACRLEQFYDRDAVVIASIKNASFNLLAGSFNIDYRCLKSFLIRAEIKQLYNSDPIFMTQKIVSRYNLSAALSMAVRF